MVGDSDVLVAASGADGKPACVVGVEFGEHSGLQVGGGSVVHSVDSLSPVLGLPVALQGILFFTGNIF